MTIRKKYADYSKKVKDAIETIEECISKGDIVYSQNIHCVGRALCIGRHELDEVVGNQLYWDNIKLTNAEHTQLKSVLEEYWNKQGKQTKERGLY